MTWPASAGRLRITGAVWAPRDTIELEQRVRSGTLAETPSFDAKLQLPEKKKNESLAVDVAAMSTDGGVLLYGVDEDEAGSPRLLAPFALAGSRERISQIVSTSISEVPHIDVRAYPLDDDPSRGYIAVIVPPSPRAPHQVSVKGNLRFYGRDATGNRILTEGEIARLYARRQRWEADRRQLLETAIERAEFAPADDRAFLYAFASPAAGHETLLEYAIPRLQPNPLSWAHRLAAQSALAGTYSPAIDRCGYWRRLDADYWRLSTATPDGQRDRPEFLLDVDFSIGGAMYLFCGRASDTRLAGGPPKLIEALIGGNVDAFLRLAGDLATTAGYFGPVDVGVAVTGMRGAHSLIAERRMDSRAYPTDRYQRTTRLAAGELAEAPERAAHALLRSLFEATTGEADYNLWDHHRATGRR